MPPLDSICPWLVGAFETLQGAAAGERLGHAWLITGPRDVGKRNLAYVFAGRLLAMQMSTPRMAAPSDVLSGYRRLAETIDLHPDLHRIVPEDEKRSISVQQIRDMTASLALTPHAAGPKVVIIEVADSMTTGAANALLKVLEEPTADTYLLLLAEQPGRLPATIRSRCQKLNLKPPPAGDTLAWLGRSGQAASQLPSRLLQRSPISAAKAVEDADYYNNYSNIYSDIKAFYAGKTDPYTLAEKWQKGTADLALACLIDSLQNVIQYRLVPDRSNLVTDSGDELIDNTPKGLAIDSLFEGLEIAEKLRDQIGRGINVELALKALLAGLDPTTTSRVK